jgi:hypothetical protein
VSTTDSDYEDDKGGDGKKDNKVWACVVMINGLDEASSLSCCLVGVGWQVVAYVKQK